MLSSEQRTKGRPGNDSHEMMLPKSVRTFPEKIAVFSSAVKSGEALTAASEPAWGARGA